MIGCLLLERADGHNRKSQKLTIKIAENTRPHKFTLFQIIEKYWDIPLSSKLLINMRVTKFGCFSHFYLQILQIKIKIITNVNFCYNLYLGIIHFYQNNYLETDLCLQNLRFPVCDNGTFDRDLAAHLVICIYIFIGDLSK